MKFKLVDLDVCVTGVVLGDTCAMDEGNDVENEGFVWKFC